MAETRITLEETNDFATALRIRKPSSTGSQKFKKT